MATDTTDRYLQWLTAQIGPQTDYHNHKETMAWVATTFYIPGIIILGYQANKLLEWPLCWVVILFVFLFILAITFVAAQFYLRSKAADTVAALMKVVNDFCKDSDTVLLLFYYIQTSKQLLHIIILIPLLYY